MADNVYGGSGNASLPVIATDDVSSVHYQRVKLDGGGNGLAVPIVAGQTTASASLPVVLATDGTLIPGTSAGALGKAEDAAHSSGDTGVMALGVANEAQTNLSGTDGDYTPVATNRKGNPLVEGNVAHDAVDAGNPVKIGGKATNALPTGVAPGDRVEAWYNQYGNPMMGAFEGAQSDGVANASTAFLLGHLGDAGELASRPMLFNGTTWDRQRNNEDGTLLASAARTAQTTTATQTNYNARGIVLTMEVTAKAAATTFIVWLRLVGTATGLSGFRLLNGWAAVAGTNAFVFVYPGATTVPDSGAFNTSSTAVFTTPLPRSWYLDVYPSDANSVTYAVTHSYIL